MTATREGPRDRDRSLDRVTVLLVDDDETWARVTGRLLASNNEAFDVTTANTLSEGRAEFDRLDPDCVICDYQLGEGTGMSLLETVRKRDQNRPFLLVTGRGDESVASEAIGQGVTDYIRKDQDDDEAGLLASRVRKAVRSYRAESALERERRSKTALLNILTGTTAETDLSRQFCRRLVTERGYACAWIARESGSGPPAPQAVAGHDEYLDAVYDAGNSLPAGEPAQLALDRGEPVRVRFDGTAPWQSNAREHGFDGALAVPIDHDGVRLGVLAVYTDDGTTLTELEQEILREYAETVGYALRNAERKRSLLSPRSVTVQARVDTAGLTMGVLTERLPDTESLDILSTLLRDDGTTLYVMSVDSLSDRVEAAVADADGVHSITVDRSATPTRCELVVDAPTPAARLAAHGVVVQETTVSAERLSLSLAIPDDKLVSTVQAALSTEFSGADVSTIWTGESTAVPATEGELLSAMTDRQREVLRHALDVGYFERPRETTATELADQFDLSRATVSQHLRSAQRKVFTQLFPHSDGD